MIALALCAALLAGVGAAGRLLVDARRHDPDRRDLAAIQSFSTARRALRRSLR